MGVFEFLYGMFVYLLLSEIMIIHRYDTSVAFRGIVVNISIGFDKLGPCI